MPVTRLARPLSVVMLFNGLLYLALTSDTFAADRIADAKKYTEDLKKSKDAKVRATALLELGKLAAVSKDLAADALPDIYKALDDKDPGVRSAAAQCLGMCDEPIDKAVPLLVKMLKDDKEESAKIGAVKGLAAMGPNAKSALGDMRKIAKDAGKDSKLAKTIIQAAKMIAPKN